MVAKIRGVERPSQGRSVTVERERAAAQSAKTAAALLTAALRLLTAL
jgi:hypothetical protein